MAPVTLPPGFRFHPTDEELVAYYLDRKIHGRAIELEIIPEVDLYKCEPWDLPDKSFLPGKDMEWYFYSPRDKKYPNGSRTNRATRGGYWKATGKDRAVQSNKRAVGMKKTLVYYKGRAPHGIRTSWVMHEYRLIDSASSSTLKDSYALCRVFKKNIQIPKTKESGTSDSIEVKEPVWSCDDQQLLAGDHHAHHLDNSEREPEDEKLNDNKVIYTAKFPSDTSSELTQSTPAGTAAAEDSQAPLSSDEANSSADMYSLGFDFSSSLIQDIQMPAYSSHLHYQFPYPPLELEDFPQIYISEPKPNSRQENIDDYVMSDHKCRDSINGTLEEIFSLCSSEPPNSHVAFSMQD